ncbi:MAG: hypothetical protein E7365_06455 [Clostridiales bacterium]|nr:hypothetical protein [Clostridiales bacterium]
MNTYSIAGLLVNMECLGKSAIQAEKYLTDFTETPDITLKVKDELVENLSKQHSELSQDDCLYIYLSKYLNAALLDFDCFVLHSSAVAYENNAYLFSADSGTGKSTHTNLWKQVFESAKIINDDKPAIRLINGSFYACGTPFSGSSPLNENICIPLKAICFLERGEENKIEQISDKKTVIYKLLSQTLRRAGNDKTLKLMELLDKLIEKTPVYKLTCLPNEDAAILAHKIMSK